jgi:hypothetical protein
MVWRLVARALYGVDGALTPSVSRGGDVLLCCAVEYKDKKAGVQRE